MGGHAGAAEGEYGVGEVSGKAKKVPEPIWQGGRDLRAAPETDVRKLLGDEETRDACLFVVQV